MFIVLIWRHPICNTMAYYCYCTNIPILLSSTMCFPELHDSHGSSSCHTWYVCVCVFRCVWVSPTHTHTHTHIHTYTHTHTHTQLLQWTRSHSDLSCQLDLVMALAKQRILCAILIIQKSSRTGVPLFSICACMFCVRAYWYTCLRGWMSRCSDRVTIWYRLDVSINLGAGYVYIWCV